MDSRANLLKNLDGTVSQILEIYQNMANPEMTVYENWTAKDVLAHITFWHESFARTVRDLANGIKPTPLKGRYSDLTQQCLHEMRPLNIETITNRFAASHHTIQENILNIGLLLIPYKKGSRDYTPEEHLNIVNQHINDHLNDIKKADRKL